MDFLRVVAISAVVLGHWLISAIGRDQRGELTGTSALGLLTWAFPITWVVQVMPLFFIVGGYANAASVSSHRRRGVTAVAWLQERSARLIRPTTTLLAVLAGGAVIVQAVGVDPELTRLAVWVASIPLWFLCAYLVVVMLTPVMYHLHRRFGWRVLAVLVVLVGLGDLARLNARPDLGAGSFVFGWLVIYQLGFFWRDGQLTSRLWIPMLAGGLIALTLLTYVGPYPVSMVDVSGYRPLNASPPTLALLATTAFQFGLVLMLRGPAERWLRRRRPWRIVTAANSVVFTVFLWHMCAVLLVVGVLNAIHRLPTPPPATTRWWLWRPGWLAMCLLMLAILVAIFGRVEIRGPRPSRFRPAHASRLTDALAGLALGMPVTVAAYAAVIIGLLGNSLAPRDGRFALGIPTAALVGYGIGAGLLRLLRTLRPSGRDVTGMGV